MEIISFTIFYKVKATNECFKLVPVDNIENLPKEELNNLLDSIGDKDLQFITEKEFEKSHDKWMQIDVMDSTNKFKIATLTIQKID
jgi:hypothetical protein